MSDSYDDKRGGRGGDAGASNYRGRKVAGRLGLKPDELVFYYKDTRLLQYFITERGKIMPQRMTGLNAKQQRALARAIKRAREVALLPYTRADV